MLQYNATQMFIETFDSVANNNNNNNNYPHNNKLLSSAVRYNNRKVFEHLLKHPNIRPDFESLAELFRRDNFDLLQQYLTPFTQQSIHECLSVSGLIKAVVTGNESLVRLLLQHMTIDMHSNGLIDPFKFIRGRGISVAMLKVLHEEFGCLYSLKTLKSEALRHSVKYNQMDSVQYILENHPSWVIEDPLISSYLCQCAKQGNIEMFQLLMRSVRITRYLRNDINHVVKVAWDHGHVEFIKYIFEKYIGNTIITKNSEHYVRACFETPPNPSSMDPAKLRVTLLAAIRHDDLVSVEANVNMVVELDAKTCRKMSKEMANAISCNRATQMRFSGLSIFNMVKAMAQPESNITADIVSQFIVNCRHKVPTYLNEAMILAAGHSAQVMQLLHTQLNIAYSPQCFRHAIKRCCRETLCLLFPQTEIMKDDAVKTMACELLQCGSLDDVTFLLNHMDYIRQDPSILDDAMCNDHWDVVEYVVKLYTREQLEGVPIQSAVDQALIQDRPDFIQSLQQLSIFEHLDTKIMVRPSLENLTQLAKYNAYHSLEYHFNSPLFNGMSVSHRLRTIHSILNKGYKCGATRVIKLCTDQIDALVNQHQQQQRQQLHTIDTAMNPQCSYQLETTVHSVFRDRKLGMFIMEHVGLVHKSLGVESDQVIKGSKLLENHCLIDYIQYGATEWFLQSYTSRTFDNNTIVNTELLDMAYTMCDQRAVDVLMANTRMSIARRSATFVKNVSTCTHPEWERLFDQYVLITFQSGRLEIPLDFVQHPSFLRKLIQCDAKLDTSKYTEVENLSWITKPWALEKVELLDQHVFRYFVESTAMTRLFEDRSGYVQSFINEICSCGRGDYLDLVLSRIRLEDQSFSLESSLSCSISHGHLAMVERIFNELKAFGTIMATDFILVALSQQHLGVANFILDQLPSDRIKSINILVINSNLLSVDLIERLMAIPQIILNCKNILGNAIKIGNKVLVDKLLEESNNDKWKTLISDYRGALSCAIEKRDMELVKRIMAKDQTIKPTIDHLCSLLEVVGLPGDNKISMESFIEFANIVNPEPRSFSSRNIVRLLLIASSKSISVIKWIINHFTTYTNDEDSHPNSVVHNMSCRDLESMMNNCYKQSDFESIDYVVQLASVTKHKLINIIKVENCNASVLAHLFDKGYISVDDIVNDKTQSLTRLVDYSMVRGDTDIIRVVYQNCTSPSQLKRYLPSLRRINDATKRNYHQLLCYLFEGDRASESTSPFERVGWKPNMLVPLLNSIRHKSCRGGNLKIIAMCDRLLASYGKTSLTTGAILKRRELEEMIDNNPSQHKVIKL
ncbi:hypothetical protein SAMD00019534_100320 [Acytostelium subglobosum LB1]|uniref:hypothetical protein n=1 Tax=Acytostelium subglobosum LB1 TaxID=1410327 RepID=UPI000644DD6D|nr:hypothetical protein SAMD00019534_100320 [Acytostelium subglobosum LB1]GAM26857.1 hypothetical protein SAMD00019534_100320 [Acytostelium subglobosum LB1]|eukprot:XP_012750125.1 hypothetical protein SAMD00019534_100320 [Acytostelium subglobosum LB1]